MFMSRCLRHLLALLLILFWLLSVPPTVWGQNTEAVLEFSPSTLQVAAGQTIDVAIEVKEVVGLYGFDVTVSFDPAIVEVVDFDPALEGDQVALGLFLDPGFVIFNQARNDLGQLRLVMTQLNPSEAKSGRGNLMVIRFRARQAGETPLLLVAGELAQRDGTSFVPQLIDGQLAVTSASAPQQSPTPIPAQLAGTPLPTTAPDLLPAAPQATPTAATPIGATPIGATPQAAETATPVATDQAALAAGTTAPLNASSPTPAVPASAISTGTGADAAANVEFTEAAATAVPAEIAASISGTTPEVVAASLMVEEATAVAADSATAVAVIGSGVAGDNGKDTPGSPQNSGQISLLQVIFSAISLFLLIVLIFFFLSRKRQSKPYNR